MNKLAVNFGCFFEFVTRWVTNTGIVFASQIREREREREVIKQLAHLGLFSPENFLLLLTFIFRKISIKEVFRIFYLYHHLNILCLWERNCE